MKLLLSLLLLLLLCPAALAQQTSAPVVLQWFESSWGTMERRTPDLFSSGYGAVWTPPPGRALFTGKGGGIGYDIYDRFDLGSAGDETLYGTEAGYRAMIRQVQRTGGSVYVDYVHHHVGSMDIPGYVAPPGAPATGRVQDRGDYPGFVLSNVGASDGDTYPNPPPAPGGDPAFEYQYRLAELITLNFTQSNGNSFVRNPVPGFANNVPQSGANWAVPTATRDAGGAVVASNLLRQANIATEANRRFYPDMDGPSRTITDGGVNYTVYDFNTANPAAGDPTSEGVAGYMMRYAQWLVQDIGVDGLRVDAARHVPLGAGGDPYNPTQVDVPRLVDRAVFGASKRTNLDGSRRDVFQFQEVFSGDYNLQQSFIRKDINPATPNTVGGNRDVLDFPLWFAMRSNLSNNGLNNDWYNIRAATQNALNYSTADPQFVDKANNGNNAIGFVYNHDEGGLHLDNVAHAFVLMRPGNAYVYFRGDGEFDRTNTPNFFLKQARGDALGGQYGDTLTTLVDIRNTHGRGDFRERYIDDRNNPALDKFSNVYVFERENSALVGLNSALGTVTNYDERTTDPTAFAPGAVLVELTGNADDATVDPLNQIPSTVRVAGDRSVTLRIPRNQNTSGVEHGKGYVIYGLATPQGTLAVSNVDHTIAGEAQTPQTNGTARLTSIDVIKANTFTVTLNTAPVTLPAPLGEASPVRDRDADGDNALLKLNEGIDLNNSGGVDYVTPGSIVYGFEEFLTQNSDGYSDPNGFGAYQQVVDATQLPEGLHYLTARAFRHRGDGGPAVFSDFRKVVYVDRLKPVSDLVGINEVAALVKSLDQTAQDVHVFVDLPLTLSDADVRALASGSNQAEQIDRDLFAFDFGSPLVGNHAITLLTIEMSGTYNVQRFAAIPEPGVAVVLLLITSVVARRRTRPVTRRA